MLFEILSSVVMGGVAATTYYHKIGGGDNDHPKIVKIASNCGLTSKDGNEIRIYRKSRSKENNYTEYVYKIPHGLAFKSFHDKMDFFQDGLNIKRSAIDLSVNDLKQLRLGKDLVKQIKELLHKKRKLRKEIEMSYDGMLRIRVYNEPLTDMLLFDDKTFKRCKGWEVPVGLSRTEYVKHDFDKIAHIIVAGTTDFGKSNWLKSTIATLIHNKPDHASFTLIDLKGGLSFNRFNGVRQVESIAKNSDEALEALKAVQSRMNKTMEYLLDNGFEDVKEAGLNNRHFIVIDEAADIGDDDKCQEIITDIARRGRAAGYRLIYATQYPTTETVKPQVKRNAIGRLCFVLDDATASRVVLDSGGAEQLPPIQGRAIYKAQIKKHTVQTPYIKNDFIKETVKPHINIRPREERSANGKGDSKGTEGRKHTLVVEETELS